MKPSDKRKRTLINNAVDKFSRSIKPNDFFYNGDKIYQIIEKAGKKLILKPVKVIEMAAIGFDKNKYKPDINNFIGLPIIKFIKEGFIKINGVKFKKLN
jgi:regulatory protein YycH of two-component signal transduction system YycFG